MGKGKARGRGGWGWINVTKLQVYVRLHRVSLGHARSWLSIAGACPTLFHILGTNLPSSQTYRNSSSSPQMFQQIQNQLLTL